MASLKFYNEGWGRRIKIELGDSLNHYLDSGARSKTYSSYPGLKDVDTLILSHFHDDHFRSLQSFRSEQSKFYYNTFGLTLGLIRSKLSTVNNFTKFLDIVISSNVICKEKWAGDTITVGSNTESVLFTVHYPLRPTAIANAELERANVRLSYELDRGIRNLINEKASYEMYSSFADYYAQEIVYYISDEQFFNQFNQTDGDMPIERVKKYIYLEMITKLLAAEDGDRELITKLFKKAKIKKSKAYLKFFNMAKTQLEDAHEYNLVLTAAEQTIYLPGDIPQNKVLKYNPQINFKRITVFEMPHHGTNESKYWSSEYNYLAPTTTFIRCYDKYRGYRAYDPIVSGTYIGLNSPYAGVTPGMMNCINTIPVNHYLEISIP